MKEYKAVVYREGLIGSVLLGASKVDPVRLTNFLNEHAKQGWRVIALESEQRRELLMFKRESLVIILEKDAA